MDYNSLVTQTFCDNAIRSVMMVDDQFIPYPNLVQSLIDGEKVDEQLLITSQSAGNLEKFFQEKHILCDIGNTSSNLDIEQIRKSDLLIIDYHLENEDPRKTLEILSGLKESQHFNLAIVYTSNELNKVWMQIASSFIVAKDINTQIEKIEGLDDFWSDTILPSIEANTEYSLTDKDLVKYLRTGKTKGEIKRLLARSHFREFKEQICDLIHDYYINKHQISSSTIAEDLSIFGDENGNKWIKSGNVFVCLYRKSANDIQEDPFRIWETLQESLVNWEPTYYQLIQSEIQNHIESDSMAFNSIHDNDKHGQAAWLKEVLKPQNQTKTFQFIKNIYADISEELSFKFNNNEELSSFIDSTFKLYKDEFDPASGKDLTQFCCEKMKLTFDANKTNKDMYHALNMHLSSKDYRERHISTGTVLYDQDRKIWYVCVSPACDMVPAQETAPINKRLTPHRMIQVLTLFKVSAEEALENATRSKYIYTYDNGERLYFSVTNPISDLPVSDYLVILNYTTKLDERYHEAFIFETKGDDIDKVRIKLKLKSQLRTGYAERFQNMASHHSGRIGVDFIKGFEPQLPEIVVTPEA